MSLRRGSLPELTVSRPLRFYRDTVRIKTTDEFEIIDITAEVEKAIENAEVYEGYALVYSPHTTCAVIINERESGLLADIRSTLERLVPRLDTYQHDDFAIRTENMNENETKNAHSHLRQLIAGRTSEYVAVGGGSLLLGQWQRVMFMELDRARERQVLIQVCGV